MSTTIIFHITSPNDNACYESMIAKGNPMVLVNDNGIALFSIKIINGYITKTKHDKFKGISTSSVFELTNLLYDKKIMCTLIKSKDGMEQLNVINVFKPGETIKVKKNLKEKCCRIIVLPEKNSEYDFTHAKWICPQIYIRKKPLKRINDDTILGFGSPPIEPPSILGQSPSNSDDDEEPAEAGGGFPIVIKKTQTLFDFKKGAKCALLELSNEQKQKQPMLSKRQAELLTLDILKNKIF
jgi:hypothetical protein